MAKTAKAPDYEAAAEKQGQSSMEQTNYQTNANRPDQYTPFGNQTWTQTATRDPVTGNMVPHWSQTTTLDPDLQRSLDAQQNLQTGRSEIGAGMLGRIAQEFAPQVDFSQFDPMGGRVQGGNYRGDLGGAGQYMGQAGDALMAQFNSRMDPQFQQAGAQLETTLRNRGLSPGDQAYDSELAKLRQQQGDQRNQAMYQAQQLSAGEAQRLQGMDENSLQAHNAAVGAQFGQDMSSSGYDTQRRQQQIAELMSQRGMSLNEANALISGQQVAMPSMPGFNAAGKADTVNYSGAAGQQFAADSANANAQNAMTGQLVGAVASPFSITGSFGGGT